VRNVSEVEHTKGKTLMGVKLEAAC